MAAVRVDAGTGIEERVEHISTPRGRIYAWKANPPGALTCVVICSSIFGDFSANYHRERRLGLSLAANGHAVMRFHYIGEGNSDGERSDMTFLSLCEDTRAAIDHAEAAGFSKLAIVGTRVAAAVAAASIASIPGVPLVLWEPVAKPLRFIKEANRARLMSRLANTGDSTAGPWTDELSQEGVLDLMGYDIYPPLVESLTTVDLIDVMGPERRPILLAGFDDETRVVSRLTTSLESAGFDVDAKNYALGESWWFQSEKVPEVGELVSDTVAWLSKKLSGGNGS